LPGTTTAMTDFITSSAVFTHDAAAMITRPVLRSTASTDHVAAAVEGTSSDPTSSARTKLCLSQGSIRSRARLGG
jgi:hypothetical protein